MTGTRVHADLYQEALRILRHADRPLSSATLAQQLSVWARGQWLARACDAPDLMTLGNGGWEVSGATVSKMLERDPHIVVGRVGSARRLGEKRTLKTFALRSRIAEWPDREVDSAVAGRVAVRHQGLMVGVSGAFRYGVFLDGRLVAQFIYYLTAGQAAHEAADTLQGALAKADADAHATALRRRITDTPT